jgi:hypothetical protein
MGPRAKASGLAPDGLAEIDLIGVGDRAGSGADRAADQRTRDRVSNARSDRDMVAAKAIRLMVDLPNEECERACRKKFITSRPDFLRWNA